MTNSASVDTDSLIRVDVLEALLDGPRARGAFLLRALLDPPWSLRIEDEAPLTVLAVLRGVAWLCPDEQPPLRMDTGQLAIVRGPDHYTVADHPTTPPNVVIYPEVAVPARATAGLSGTNGRSGSAPGDTTRTVTARCSSAPTRPRVRPANPC